MEQRVAKLCSCYPALGGHEGVIQTAYALLRDCLRSGGKLMLCGNGGSAADAEHWAGELLKAFAQPRPLGEAWLGRLSHELANKLQGALPAIPLTGFFSFTSAWGNDVDPQLAFAQLVFALGQPGDVLVGISTSGNARNVIAAFEVARAKGVRTLALTGRSGGVLAGLADLALRVPADSTHEAQELHLPIYHCLSLMLEEEFFGEGGGGGNAGGTAADGR